MLKCVFAVVAVAGLWAAYQYVMYHRENGVFVADKYTDPPMSKRIYHIEKPLAEAVGATKGGSWATGEGSIPYMSTFEKWSYWNALRKFPTLESCLINSNADELDILKLNWNALRTKKQAMVCFHHIAHHLKRPEKVADWLRLKGFEVMVWENLNISYLGEGTSTGVNGRWVPEGETPFSLFSQQTFSQRYSLLALLSRAAGTVGTPSLSFFLNETSQNIDIEISTKPSL